MVATDTASYSDIVFGLFRLLGYRFSPRMADLGGTGFWRTDVAIAGNLVRAAQDWLLQILTWSPLTGSTRPATLPRGWLAVLLRLAYLGVTNAFAMLRLLPMSDHAKDVEILALRHQLTVLQRQHGPHRPRFEPADRALLAALLLPLPQPVLRELRLLVRPDTVLRWHRNLLARRHAAVSRPKRPGRPRTVRSIRLLVLRLARENPDWGYRRVHGELLVLGINVAASTVWQILVRRDVAPCK
jgi:hypothetical protein